MAFGLGGGERKGEIAGGCYLHEQFKEIEVLRSNPFPKRPTSQPKSPNSSLPYAFFL